MTDHPCPFDAGTLLALGSIAEARSTQPNAPAGARRLAALCSEERRQNVPTLFDLEAS